MIKKLETAPIDIGGTSFFWFLKRSIDILLSIILIPFVVVVCFLVWLVNPFSNPGKLLYVQSRYGKDLKLFNMYKLRTMVGPNLISKYAVDEEHRIRPFGRFLRRYHIDELPQIFNTLKGEMSYIGPRPEQKKFVNTYLETIPEYQYRHVIRPGLSGLAQVEVGYTSDADGTARKLEKDLAYIKNAGFLSELRVVMRTIPTILKRN